MPVEDRAGRAPFVVSRVPPWYVEAAYTFHVEVAGSNEHLLSRTDEAIQKFSRRGNLFAARHRDTGEFMALCYAALEGQEWEIGGLTVRESAADLGMGTFLVQYALAHTMALEDPWGRGQRVIAHVHAENEDPRNLLVRLGFVKIGTEEYPGEDFPGLKRNAAGKVVGDIYEFTREGLIRLENFFRSFDGTLKHSSIKIDLGPIFELVELQEALAETVRDLKS